MKENHLETKFGTDTTKVRYCECGAEWEEIMGMDEFGCWACGRRKAVEDTDQGNNRSVENSG